MDRALYIAMSGAKQNTLGQTANANNLANTSTTGFRADYEQSRAMPVFGDYYPTRAYAMQERPTSDFRPGALDHTGRSLDVAIDNQGWFSVLGPDGQEAYTRRGDLTVDALGRLVNGSGLQVVGAGGPIVLPPYESISIGNDGIVSIQALGEGPEALAEVDQLKLVNPDLTTMDKGEDGLFRVRDAAPGQVQPVDLAVRVVPEHLETSNVKVVTEMTEMLSLHRQYEMQVKMMKRVEENAEATTRILDIQ